MIAGEINEKISKTSRIYNMMRTTSEAEIVK